MSWRTLIFNTFYVALFLIRSIWEQVTNIIYDTTMDTTQVLLAAQSPNSSLRTVAEGNLTQFQEQKLPNFLLSLLIEQA
jgi:predicted XRE-type DNA-binding protein